FEKTTGITVTTARGASQGDGPTTIGAQLRRDVPADVVIMSREGSPSCSRRAESLSARTSISAVPRWEPVCVPEHLTPTLVMLTTSNRRCFTQSPSAFKVALLFT